MTAIRREGEGFVVEARLLAEVFGLGEDAVRAQMRDGRITSRCERGEAEDAGRWRLTFQSGTRACRFIVDAEGRILSRARFPGRATPGAAPRPDPAAPRQP